DIEPRHRQLRFATRIKFVRLEDEWFGLGALSLLAKRETQVSIGPSIISILLHYFFQCGGGFSEIIFLVQRDSTVEILGRRRQTAHSKTKHVQSKRFHVALAFLDGSLKSKVPVDLLARRAPFAVLGANTIGAILFS